MPVSMALKSCVGSGGTRHIRNIGQIPGSLHRCVLALHTILACLSMLDTDRCLQELCVILQWPIAKRSKSQYGHYMLHLEKTHRAALIIKTTPFEHGTHLAINRTSGSFFAVKLDESKGSGTTSTHLVSLDQMDVLDVTVVLETLVEEGFGRQVGIKLTYKDRLFFDLILA